MNYNPVYDQEPLSRIEYLLKNGGGGGGGDDPHNTASQEDIDGIIDDIFPDGQSTENGGE